MARDFYKKVAPQPKPCVTVRELVTKHGDLWALCSFNRSHAKSVCEDRGPDSIDAAIMRLCERGELPRVSF